MTYGWEALVLCPLSSSRVFSVVRFLKVTKRHLTGRPHRSVEALTHEGFRRLLAARSAHCRVWECFCAGEKKFSAFHRNTPGGVQGGFDRGAWCGRVVIPILKGNGQERAANFTQD